MKILKFQTSKIEIEDKQRIIIIMQDNFKVAQKEAVLCDQHFGSVAKNQI